MGFYWTLEKTVYGICRYEIEVLDSMIFWPVENGIPVKWRVLFQRMKQTYYTDSPHSSTNQMEYVEVL